MNKLAECSAIILYPHHIGELRSQYMWRYV